MAKASERRANKVREREVVDRARANKPLMDLYHRSLASLDRGEPTVAWTDLQVEAREAETRAGNLGASA